MTPIAPIVPTANFERLRNFQISPFFSLLAWHSAYRRDSNVSNRFWGIWRHASFTESDCTLKLPR
jgi:hypothetical protein